MSIYSLCKNYYVFPLKEVFVKEYEREGKPMTDIERKKPKQRKKYDKHGNRIPFEVKDEIKKKAKELKKQAVSVGILTESESLALASQMALGLVNDRFGMEMSASDRIKALAIINDYHKGNKGNGSQEQLERGDQLVINVRKVANGDGK